MSTRRSDYILVTGGAGFIGSNFVRWWLKNKPDNIVNLDKLTYAGHLESLKDVLDHRRHVFVRGDVCDAELLADILARYRPWAIVHFAAESHVDRSIDCPGQFVQTNVVGTYTLLEATLNYWLKLPLSQRKAFRFLHVSTDEVYGSLATGGRFSESDPYAPNSPYAASKAAADHFVRAYWRTYGLPTIITHSCNNYGPYQYPEKFIPVLIRNALQGKPLPLYGDGTQVREWIFVEDHCRALATVLQKGTVGEHYNIGSGCELSNVEVARRVCGHIDRLCASLPHYPAEDLIEFVEDRPGHDHRYALDSSRVRRLGWEPQVEFDKGIGLTVEWYIKNRDWVDRVLAEDEAGQRLGLRGGEKR